MNDRYNPYFLKKYRRGNKFIYKRFHRYLFFTDLLRTDTLYYFKKPYIGFVKNDLISSYLRRYWALPSMTLFLNHFYRKRFSLMIHKRFVLGKWVHKSFFYFRKHNRWHYLHLYNVSKLKQIFDNSYIVNKFIYWYSSIGSYLKIRLFNKKITYSSYKNKYDKTFFYNYQKVYTLLNCYKFNSNNLFLFNKQISFKHFYNFIGRTKYLFDYNMYYNYFYRNKCSTHLNYFFRKKLLSLDFLKYNKHKTYSHNTYVYDVASIYYNSINNLDYTFHLDEKYNYFLKNILLNKLQRNNSNILLKNNVSSTIFHTKKNSYNILPMITFKSHFYKLSFFFNIYNMNKKNFINNYFYSFFLLKYHIFILRDSIYFFFKDFFISNYKLSVYKKKYNKKHFDVKIGIWYKYLVVDQFYNLTTVLEIRQNKFLYFIRNHKFLFNISYLEWFIFFYNTIRNKKNYRLFSYYKINYDMFYNKHKRRVFNFQKKKYLDLVVNRLLLENKDEFINNVSTTLLDKNPYFQSNFNDNELDLLLSKYQTFCYNKLSRKYKFGCTYNKLSFKKRSTFKRTRLTIDIPFKDNKVKGYLDYLFEFNSYCNSLINKDSNYNNNSFFQIVNNKSFLYNSSDVSDSQKDRLPSSSNFWCYYLNNKKIKIIFIMLLVDLIYSSLKTNSISFFSLQKNFFFFYNVLNYFNFRESFFYNTFNYKKKNNNFLKLNVSDHLKISKITKVMNNSNTFNTLAFHRYSSYSYIFSLRSFYNLYIYFFLFLKKLLLINYLIDSFSMLNNTYLIFNITYNNFFFKQKVLQQPYLTTYLDLEINELL